MKRKFFGRTLKKTFLAVPAAALMLGVSQAQTTIGINFVGGSYGYNGVYHGIGYAQYYSGFPVTATAFGVNPGDWVSTISPATGTLGDTNSSGYFPYYGQDSGTVTAGPANNLSVSWSTADTWGTLIDENLMITNSAGYLAPPPGNDEVTWGVLDNTGWTINLSGLNATFPNGYVIECIGADKVTTKSQVSFTDGSTFNDWLGFNSIYTAGNGKYTASVGLLESTNFTSDSLTISNPSRNVSSTTNCALAGFIITDEPVIVQSPPSATNNAGSPFVLTANAIGIPPLSYQWQLNGVNLTGATNSNYTNASAAISNAGNYNVIVTNPYGHATSATAAITINQTAAIVQDLPLTVTNFSAMNASFNMVAGGLPPLAYQWSKNGVPLADTNATLTLTSLQTSDAGNYQVIVTNIYGSATSSVASLTVLPATPPYEGFAYPAGNLNGQNGGTGGWSGAWIQPTNYDNDPYGGGHLVFTSATPWEATLSQLASSGNGLQLAAVGASDYCDLRNLQTTLGGNGYGSIYLSFVAQVTNNTWGGVELVKDGTPSLFLGECWEGSDWGWGTRGTPDAKSTIAPTVYSLLVYRFDYTPTNTTVRLYVNPSSLSVEPTNPAVSGTEPIVAFDQISIVTHGAYGTGTGPDGVLGDFRIGGTWASVTPYIARTNLPALTVKMNPGGIIQDTKPVGIPYDGLNYATTWLASSGPDFNGVTFDGVQQFDATNHGQITVAPETTFNTTNGTISFWMLYNLPGKLPGPGTGAAMLFDRRTTSGIVVTLSPTSGSIQFQQVNDATGSYATTTVGNTDVADGDWHNVTITYDQLTNGVVSIYVDGALDTSAVNSSPWSWPTNQEIELGRSHDSYWYLYDGQLTDFRIYNQILTSAEISDLAAPATSGNLESTNALVLRYSFANNNALFGQSIVWPYGTLVSSPVLGPNAVWTPVTNTLGNAVSPQPVVLNPSVPAMFYRIDAGLP